MSGPRPRGICPVCKRNVATTGDYITGPHGTKDRKVWPPEYCAGWGQPAMEPITS